MNAPQNPTDSATTGHPPELVPRGTTPTWEIEMLLSGAVVFALLQVPAALDRSFDAASVRVGGAWGVASFLVYCYAKAIVYSLILTFVFHLAARAYWIALVGVNSVYPGGPRWDQARLGRLLLEETARSLAPMDQLIARADDRCSLIFAGGILLVLLALYSLMLTSIIGGAAYAFDQLLMPPALRGYAFWAVAVMVLVPMIVIGLVDRHGAKPLGEGRLSALIRRVHRFTARMPVLRFANPILLVIMSNRPKQRTYVLMTAALIGVLYFVIGEAMLRRESLRIDSYRYLPDQPTGLAIDSDHYETRRKSAVSVLPYIQAEVIEGPYVRLFVPYNGERHEPALALACPNLEPYATGLVRLGKRGELDEKRARETLRCFAQVLAIALDGTRIAAIDLNFANDAASEQRGVVAMIPVRDLAPGRHLLTVRRPPREEDEIDNPVGEEQPTAGDAPGRENAADAAPPAEPTALEKKPEPLLEYEIAFWR